MGRPSDEALKLARDRIIKAEPSARGDGWATIVKALESVMARDEIMYELAVPEAMLNRWLNNVVRPREMTQRLLKKALIEMLNERIGDACPTCGEVGTLEMCVCSDGYHAPGATYWPMSSDDRERVIDEADQAFDAAIRRHMEQHGPSGGAWNISSILDVGHAAIRALKSRSAPSE